MITTFDQSAILYRLLMADGSPIKAAVNAAIYIDDRLTTDVEAVVINSLPISGTEFQAGAANVNIYVPDITIKSGGKNVQGANRKRLNELAKLALDTLNDVYGEDYDFYCEYQDVIDEPETNSHYVNLRLKFQHDTL